MRVAVELAPLLGMPVVYYSDLFSLEEKASLALWVWFSLRSTIALWDGVDAMAGPGGLCIVCNERVGPLFLSFAV